MNVIPPELMQRLCDLWEMEAPIVIQVRPRDAWAILGIVQFATRNPALTMQQRELMQRFGRGLQDAITQIDPQLGETLELGWDPQHDQ